MYVRWAHGAQNTLGDNVNGGLQKFPGHSKLCRHLSHAAQPRGELSLDRDAKRRQ